MNNPAVISATLTVPESSEVWGISITGTPIPIGTPNRTTPPSATVQQAMAKASLPIQYAAAVLAGQDDSLASIAPCFDSDNARIKKQRLKNKRTVGFWSRQSPHPVRRAMKFSQ
jgi:hypothetical protein